MDKHGLENAYDLGKKVINSSLGKMLVREELECTPTLYEKGTKKIKNKTIRGAVKSDWPILLLI